MKTNGIRYILRKKNGRYCIVKKGKIKGIGSVRVRVVILYFVVFSSTRPNDECSLRFSVKNRKKDSFTFPFESCRYTIVSLYDWLDIWIVRDYSPREHKRVRFVSKVCNLKVAKRKESMETRQFEDRFDYRPARQYERTWKKLEERLEKTSKRVKIVSCTWLRGLKEYVVEAKSEKKCRRKRG